MDLIKTLENIGLRNSEAKVYLATLELGEAPASEIAKKAKLKRPSVYVTLRDLMRRGYISSYTRKKITRFVAQNPSQLISGVVEKMEAANEALPELEALSKLSKKINKPSIQYFEGLEGIISIMEDTLRVENKIIYAWADIELAWNVLADYYPKYIHKKNERNIFVKAILEESAIAQKFKDRSLIEKREVQIVPKEVFNIHNEINIYDDKISIISHEDLVGVIIQNQKIADTQRMIFELNWKMLRK